MRPASPRIVLIRPQARNALTFAMYMGLITCCEAIAGNPAIKALIITGAGEKAFAAGTDIAPVPQLQHGGDALGYERGSWTRWLGSLERLRVPTIAAIAGACTGGGAAIAAACDLRFAHPRCPLRLPIARTLGNWLSQGNLKRLSGLIGPARVKESSSTARLVGAEEALAIGLMARMVDDRAAGSPSGSIPWRSSSPTTRPLTMQATMEGLRRLAEEEAVAEGAPHHGDD